ncbi:MAG: hypothetical protein SNG35_02410 [Rikenellaceae bacterium]
MRRYIITLILCIAASTIYANDGSNHLRSLTKAIEQMGSYSVVFSIEVDDFSQGGEYSVSVSGDDASYQLIVATQTIVGNNSERTIYDGTNKEKIIERVDPTTPMIMSNPIVAFTSLDALFDSTVVEQNEEIISLELRPKDNDIVESVILEMSATDKLPKKITYRADGEELSIVIKSFTRGATESNLPIAEGYKEIDLR